jgi:hypothetical protein
MLVPLLVANLFDHVSPISFPVILLACSIAGGITFLIVLRVGKGVPKRAVETSIDMDEAPTKLINNEEEEDVES